MWVVNPTVIVVGAMNAGIETLDKVKKLMRD